MTDELKVTRSLISNSAVDRCSPRVKTSWSRRVRRVRSQFSELAPVRPCRSLSCPWGDRDLSGSVIPQPSSAAGVVAGGGGRGSLPSHEGRARLAGIPGRRGAGTHRRSRELRSTRATHHDRRGAERESRQRRGSGAVRKAAGCAGGIWSGARRDARRRSRRLWGMRAVESKCGSPGFLSVWLRLTGSCQRLPLRRMLLLCRANLH